MADSSTAETFRRCLGSIFLHKDELESQFTAAIAVANSPEDYSKLTGTATKIEKELLKIKWEIAEKSCRSFVAPHLPLGPLHHNGFSQSIRLATPYSSAHLTPRTVVGQFSDNSDSFASTLVGPKVSVNGTTFLPLLDVDAGQVPPPQKPALTYQQGNSESQDQKSKIYRAQHQGFPRTSDWRVSQKFSDVPDKQKLFLPHISFKTSESSLANFFSQYGQVVHVRIFSVPPKDPNVPVKGNLATVGFDNRESVDKILGQNFVLDGAKLMPREYISREKYHVQLKQERYQIFIGGIPTFASPEEIGQGLLEHLCYDIRDIRVVNISKGKQVSHRGFAYVDLENEDDAKYLLHHRFVYICGKRAECKANTCSMDVIDMQEHVALPESYDKPLGSLKMHNLSLRDGQLVEKCVICQVNPRNCELLWCCHRETCEECANKLQNCPKVGCGDQIVMRQLKVKPQ